MYRYNDLIKDLLQLKEVDFETITDENNNKVVIVLTGKTVIIHQYETMNYSHFVSEIEYRTKTESRLIYDILIQLDYENFSLDKY